MDPNRFFRPIPALTPASMAASAAFDDPTLSLGWPPAHVGQNHSGPHSSGVGTFRDEEYARMRFAEMFTAIDGLKNFASKIPQPVYEEFILEMQSTLRALQRVQVSFIAPTTYEDYRIQYQQSINEQFARIKMEGTQQQQNGNI